MIHKVKQLHYRRLTVALLSVCFCALVSAMPQGKKTYVDFDAEYGEGLVGQRLVNTIKRAVGDLGSNEVLLFKSATYDLKNANLTITNPATISGVVPSIDPPAARGTYQLKTSFINANRITMQTDDVTIQHLKIVAGPKARYMVNYRHKSDKLGAKAEYYTGHKLHNVRIEGGFVQIFLGSGAGLDIDHVTLYHFHMIGITGNRKSLADKMPHMSVRKSEFLVDLKRNHYNTRGFSMDAGNTEYPVIWDMNDLVIEDNLFQKGGVAFSRCENATIRNNDFKGYSMSMDAVHMEEFTNHITVENNVFEQVKPCRGFWIDREAQFTTDIKIINNTFKGRIGWIISCYATHNFTFTGNDFTQARAAKPNKVVFDFDYYQDRGKLDLPQTPYTTKMNFSNNKGLENMGKMAINLLEGDKKSKVEFPGDLTINRVPKEVPRFPDGDYMIRNKVSGKYIAAGSKGTLKLTSKKSKSAVWQFTHKKFFNNIIRNKATKNLMEVHRGYTLGDIERKNFEPLEVFQQSKWNNGKRKPHFYIVSFPQNGKDYYLIHPGGNEHKSRFVEQDGKVMLSPRYHNENKRLVPREDAELWEVIKL